MEENIANKGEGFTVTQGNRLYFFDNLEQNFGYLKKGCLDYERKLRNEIKHVNEMQADVVCYVEHNGNYNSEYFAGCQQRTKWLSCLADLLKSLKAQLSDLDDSRLSEAHSHLQNTLNEVVPHDTPLLSKVNDPILQLEVLGNVIISTEDLERCLKNLKTIVNHPRSESFLPLIRQTINRTLSMIATNEFFYLKNPVKYGHIVVPKGCGTKISNGIVDSKTTFSPICPNEQTVVQSTLIVWNREVFEEVQTGCEPNQYHQVLVCVEDGVPKSQNLIVKKLIHKPTAVKITLICAHLKAKASGFLDRFGMASEISLLMKTNRDLRENFILIGDFNGKREEMACLFGAQIVSFRGDELKASEQKYDGLPNRKESYLDFADWSLLPTEDITGEHAKLKDGEFELVSETRNSSIDTSTADQNQDVPSKRAPTTPVPSSSKPTLPLTKTLLSTNRILAKRTEVNLQPIDFKPSKLHHTHFGPGYQIEVKNKPVVSPFDFLPEIENKIDEIEFVHKLKFKSFCKTTSPNSEHFHSGLAKLNNQVAQLEIVKSKTAGWNQSQLLNFSEANNLPTQRKIRVRDIAFDDPEYLVAADELLADFNFRNAFDKLDQLKEYLNRKNQSDEKSNKAKSVAPLQSAQNAVCKRTFSNSSEFWNAFQEHLLNQNEEQRNVFFKLVETFNALQLVGEEVAECFRNARCGVRSDSNKTPSLVESLFRPFDISEQLRESFPNRTLDFSKYCPNDVLLIFLNCLLKEAKIDFVFLNMVNEFKVLKCEQVDGTEQLMMKGLPNEDFESDHMYTRVTLQVSQELMSANDPLYCFVDGNNM